MYKLWVLIKRALMNLFWSLTCIRVQQRKLLMDHLPMVVIVSGYTQARKSFTEKPDWREWGTISLCENTIRSSPKEIYPDLSLPVVIWYLIIVLEFSTQTVLNGVPSVVSGYGSSFYIMYSQMRTGNRFLPVHHCVTVEFFMPFFFVHNAGYTLSSRCWRPLLCVISWCFL